MARRMVKRRGGELVSERRVDIYIIYIQGEAKIEGMGENGRPKKPGC